ncbi:TrmH family RNA methyltransferase [Jonesia denitrificans]|uniref:tRNA/rRNA methyltransferase (SpoU) n=1 Tax=Jonesia denitrificans (strain ATCC 14870 / DSM 20603 / BCRC 15368 / CIP 55.134 / JCM 11481 / NBRC 15587 / NCTC 10816 / Prevot 55134) TaxID=471856 RepID=C7R3Q5_JONDD|nr:RNA methyltransferase [Jonesia denitrificans]ACV08762.1 tRNA/rRNA methyltransferase (SpoU) [Jonesia denitrificans DSM 20603]ASE09914.1 RNA methyltransferase [Jonesia denitrificans]QXB44569.1 RNA methyltransferase [Jonesia denitrificans]
MPDLTNPRSDRVKMVRRLSGRSSRTKHGQFLVEGPQSVRELVACRAELVRDLYVSSDRVDRYRDIYDEAHRQSLYLHTTTPEVLSAMSEDAQGIVAVARTLDTRLSSLGPVLSKACLVAVLTDVRDPGNAGTVIRAADAAGADVVILAGDSVDLMNPKVVRSSAGSLFHMPVITNASLVDVHGALKMAGIPLFGTTPYADLTLDDLVEPQGPTSVGAPHAWVFGNEAQGLSVEDQSMCDSLVRIPMYGRAESLNLAMAATICLYTSARALRTTTR